ncbi:TonB-dependent receptor plug domain-containing protein, partial [Arthrospira platensis SPKY1]|nr:TonB-dependent receptor plug domain-containing protein [Arthrospira platensis SPKY1]
RVNYHGITDDDFSPRVQVLVDGRSLHSPLFIGGVNWALMPVALEDIEYIEVVRGSNTVSYGTNAFLGVINIVTTDPTLSRGGSISASSGNQGVRDFTLRGGAQLGPSANLRISYRQMRDDGLDEIPDGGGIFSWADRNRSRTLDLRYLNQIDPANLMEVGFGHAEAVSLTGRLIDNQG